MDELLSTAIELEKVLGEIGETPYEPLQGEREEELALCETNTNKQLQLLNDILINYFGQRTNGKKGPSLGMTSIIQCQLCRAKEHIMFTCGCIHDWGTKKE